MLVFLARFQPRSMWVHNTNALYADTSGHSLASVNVSAWQWALSFTCKISLGSSGLFFIVVRFLLTNGIDIVTHDIVTLLSSSHIDRSSREKGGCLFREGDKQSKREAPTKVHEVGRGAAWHKGHHFYQSILKFSEIVLLFVLFCLDDLGFFYFVCKVKKH